MSSSQTEFKSDVLCATQRSASFCLESQSHLQLASIKVWRQFKFLLTIVVYSLSKLVWFCLMLFLHPKKTKPSRMSNPSSSFDPSSLTGSLTLWFKLFWSLLWSAFSLALVRLERWLTSPKALIWIFSPFVSVAELVIVSVNIFACWEASSRLRRYSSHCGS